MSDFDSENVGSNPAGAANQEIQMNKDSILAALPQLSLEDLTVVCSVTQSLIKGRTAVDLPPASGLAAMVFDAMGGPMNVTVPYASMAGTKWGKQFEKKVPELGKWLDQHFDGWSTNKVTQLAFLQWLFVLLANDLKRRELPRSLAMVVTNLEQIPRIVENAYPSYLESKLGGLILAHFQKPV